MSLKSFVLNMSSPNLSKNELVCVCLSEKEKIV